MKTLLFICGPNGVGKTTVCQKLLEATPHTAYVDSDACRLMNPFVLDDVTIPVIAANISSMIRHYLLCEYVETVMFSYGFHGRRREVFQLVMESLNDLSFHFVPILLTCDVDENIRRMMKDGRDGERIRRAVDVSRKAFADTDYQRLDTTDMSVDESIRAITKIISQMKEPESH